LKKASLFLALFGAVILAGCGSSDTTSQSSYNNGTGNLPYKPTTHLSHRTLVSNYYAGALQVVDATQDRLTAYTFATGTQPTRMQASPDGTLIFVINSGSNTISSLNNYQEAVKANIQLGGWTESFVTSTNNHFGFAAVYNYSNGNPPNVPGAIARFNPTDGSLNTFIPFPNVRYLAMDNAQAHLLAFTDVDDNAHWVDLTTVDVNGLPVVSVLSSLPAGTLSRPVAAFFSADSTKAYILSCGYECGGTEAPSVTEINVATASTASVVKTWPVSGARRGLMDTTANKLYVAGSSSTLTDSGGNNVLDGYFTVIDLNAGTAGNPVRIGNGDKQLIRNINGVLWVGSANCGVQSCVTLINSSGTATVLPTAKGDATGITLNSNSGEVYTIEGGQLYIYDQKANPINSYYNTDVRGQGYDVLYID
jgi:YVTN family beta-propeller protein